MPGIRDKVLGSSFGYRAFKKLAGGDRSMMTLAREHFHPAPGSRVLDVGCGNGDLADYLGDVTYVGVDHNPNYLRDEPGSAHRTLVCCDLADLSALDVGTFDLAVALGVLHHLPDDLARSVVAEVAARLAPGGRFVTVDPVFEPSQPATARVLMALDRGKFVRHPADYVALVSTGFTEVRQTIRSDLNALPYTHCILEACEPKPRRSEA